MPALKRLWMGRVEGDYNSDSDAEIVRTADDNLASPACSLTHLVVGDDWNINFWHYQLLLSRSHDTLEHLELHWIFDESVGDAVAGALERCTRVRHLTLIGNDFTNERIIAAAGATVSSLTLVMPPSDEEAAAMRAPLRTLELVNCFSSEPESFIDGAWARLRNRLPLVPALSRIRFTLMRRPVEQETEGLRELRKACKERRIRLSMHNRLLVAMQCGWSIAFGPAPVIVDNVCCAAVCSPPHARKSLYCPAPLPIDPGMWDLSGQQCEPLMRMRALPPRGVGIPELVDLVDPAPQAQLNLPTERKSGVFCDTGQQSQALRLGAPRVRDVLDASAWLDVEPGVALFVLFSSFVATQS
ncbi:hypothetical protein AURDEDRAFT_127438 [Auricularia subglabra TFB-10046 SS5]|uniref:Uncharacterized protein n=1 Tax=Auricularia subglabra (strain TFB-10046 / SS5) TaxID=717982 RepID=J0DCY3_AURST|nr:hypothetical protein AURDEDRAFT_127438 [Auricularia subglabra TFB-10046 SS5]